MDSSHVSRAREALAAIASFAAAVNAERFRLGMWNSAELVRSYLLSFELEGAGTAFSPPYVNDALARFLRTLEFVPLPPPKRILEIGSNPYFFHLLLHKFFTESEIHGANFFDHNVFSTEQGELVQRMASKAFEEDHAFSSKLFNLETVAEYPYPLGSFDLIFVCETLEHLNVDPLSVFGKIRRILAPGGHLIVTIPNAVWLVNVALMLDGYNIFDLYQIQNGIHGRHNREFTLDELTALLTKNGFEILRAETHDRYDYDTSPIITVDYTGRSQIPVARPPIGGTTSTAWPGEFDSALNRPSAAVA